MLDKLVLVSIIFILIYKYCTRNFEYWKNRKIFYFTPLLFVGNFLEIFLFRTTIGELLAKYYTKTKTPYFGIFVFNNPRLVIKSPDLIKFILVRDFNYFEDRSVASPKHDPLSANMLFMSKNPEWKAIRAKVTPIFTSGKLKIMAPLINEVGENLRKYLIVHSGKCHNAKEVCTKYATDVIAKCAFAIDAHSFDSEDAEFRKIGKMVFDFNWSVAISQISYFFLPKLVDLFRLTFMNREANDFLRNAFWKAIETRNYQKGANNKAKDLIDFIIELKEDKKFCHDVDFEGDKVVSQAAQFFLAGFETTSSTIAFALYELSLHPEIQNRLRNEIKATLEKYKSFSYETIRNMTYLNMCISETLRKYPPLPVLERQCKTDYQIPGSEDLIERGTAVYIPLLGLHYDEEYFPNPHEFNPERFDEENSAQITPFSFIPFGEGPRNCIGERFGLLSTRLALIHIFLEFEVERLSNTPVPLEFEPRSFFLGSKVGIPLKFKKIET